MTMVRRFLLLLGLFVAFCNAKVINTDASSSYVTKLFVGVAQSFHKYAELVLPSWSSPKRPPRTVKLALVGFGRTGSTSFSEALKYLGYAPIHDDNMDQVGDIYEKMMDGTFTMDQVNDAIGERGFDAPWIFTHEYVKWAATRPDIKVILTTRDPQRWAESWVTITPAAWLPEQRPFKWIPSIRQLQEYNREIMLNVPTNGKPELYDDIPTLVAGYRAWVKFVVDTVPPDRLLVFNVASRWEPLCKFLDKPIPSIPFPHINDRFVVAVIIATFQVISWIWPLLFATPFLALWWCWRLCKGRRQARQGSDSWEEPKKEV